MLPNRVLGDPEMESRAKVLAKSATKIALARCVLLEEQRQSELRKANESLWRQLQRLRKACSAMEKREIASKRREKALREASFNAVTAAASTIQSMDIVDR